MTKIYINGFSAICAQGENCEQISKNLFSTPILPTLIESTLNESDSAVCYFPAFSKLRLTLAELGDEIVKHIVNTLHASQWSEADLFEIPIFLSSTSFSMAEHEIRFLNKTNDELAQLINQQVFSLNEISAYLKSVWSNLTVVNIATSCTSSANAILYASQYIELGFINRAIVVGFESFNAITLEGFRSLGLLTSKMTPPFSDKSDGLILGEGIGCIAISNQRPLSSQSVRVVSGETLCDITNITTTKMESIVALFDHVLAKANIHANEISAIKTHATGSPANDQIEQQSIASYFSESLPRLFFKPYIGHTLGACGTLEIILLLLCIDKQRMPTQQCEQLSVQSTHADHHENWLSTGYFLLNYLGFGGSNSVLLLTVDQS